MPFTLFHEKFPEIAERETRSITVLPGSRAELPPDDYGLLEMFCDEVGCDCRRVLFSVVSRRGGRTEAVIGFGWEPPKYYAEWLRDDDPAIVADLVGPSLNLGSRQSALAPALLRVVRDVVLRDPDYVERLKRHYRMFRGAIEAHASKPARRKRRPRARRKKRKR